MIQFEQWDDKASNAEQRYLTHGAFRYFGKLPPTLTSRILGELGIVDGSVVVDLMAGSGTTLIEAGIRGATATGVDCNDLSVLVSRVKTSANYLAPAQAVDRAFEAEFGALVGSEGVESAAAKLRNSKWGKIASKARSPDIRNFDRWFPADTAFCLKALRAWARNFEDTAQREVALVIFAAIVRPASMASAAAGRIFFDSDKQPPNPFALVKKPLARIVAGLAGLADHPNWDDARVQVILGDGRAIELPEKSADLVFAHPPYFALYKYSSDVLRFELEWLEFSRRDIARREIEDGFKTTDAALADKHIDDMLGIVRAANDVAKPDGKLVIVTANSTLRKQVLPIIEGIAKASPDFGWTLRRRIERRVRFAQASYHRSADREIVRPSDEILIFERV